MPWTVSEIQYILVHKNKDHTQFNIAELIIFRLLHVCLLFLLLYLHVDNNVDNVVSVYSSSSITIITLYSLCFHLLAKHFDLSPPCWGMLLLIRMMMLV